MKRLAVFTILLFAAFSSICYAQLVVNGSFEDGYTGNGVGFIPNVSGSTIPGWTASDVDWIGALWQANAGLNSIDLSGAGKGWIRQTITTLPGTSYVLSFALAGNPDGPPDKKQLDVLVNSVSLVGNSLLEFDTKDRSRTNMGWLTFAYGFTASGSATTIEFASNTGTNYGPAIDSVEVEVTGVVVPTPEPSILYLLAGSLLGLVVSRRKRGC